MKITNYNIATMNKIISIMECIPQSYAIRNEPIVSIEMNNDYEIVAINFPAMRMRRVNVPTMGYGWMVEDWDAVFLEK